MRQPDASSPEIHESPKPVSKLKPQDETELLDLEPTPDEWDSLALNRLYTQTALVKPHDYNTHFNTAVIVHRMSNIQSTEPDHLATDYLRPEDLMHYQSAKLSGNVDRRVSYEPSYKVRPNGDQVLQKLSETMNMDLILMPVDLTAQHEDYMMDGWNGPPNPLVKRTHDQNICTKNECNVQ